MNYYALRYIVFVMLKKTFAIISLGFCLSVQASNFGPLPSKTFGQNGSLPCESSDNCPLPSQRSLQKIAEDFLSHSQARMNTLDKMEAEIRSSIETYQVHSEEVFSRSGNTELKSFLEKGKSLYHNLLDDLGLSTARHMVGGNSPFLNELKGLTKSLKQSEANIINSKNKSDIDEAKKKRIQNYISLRKNGAFSSYQHLDQVKTLIDFYELKGSLSPWISNHQNKLRLKFNSCPLKLRRTLRKLNPALRYDSDLGPLQFDVFNELKMVSALVQNSRLLTISCQKKVKGPLKAVMNHENASIELDFNLSASGEVFLPKL